MAGGPLRLEGRVCSGVVVYSLSLLICWAQRARCRAETPLIVLCRFPGRGYADATTIISSIMGLFPEQFVTRIKSKGIKWLATVTTVSEAKAAESAGADIIVARAWRQVVTAARSTPLRPKPEWSACSAFSHGRRCRQTAGRCSGRNCRWSGRRRRAALGSIGGPNWDGVAQVPEARVASAWADAIGRTAPEDTMVSRVFSGRPARSIANAYARAATSPSAPPAAPYPVQRGLTQAMRDAAVKDNDVERMQAWAGQSASLTKAIPAGEVVRRLWEDAQALLR